MARFRYRMQSILDIKMKMESQARQEFAAARMELDAEQEKLKALRARKRRYEEEARKLLFGGLRVRDILDNKNAILGMDGLIREQEFAEAAAERKLEQARMRLQEVMQERKTHEKLRENAFAEFVREEGRRESKEIDELTSYSYGRKAGEK